MAINSGGGSHDILAAALRDDLLTFAGKAVLELDKHPLAVLPHVEIMAAALAALHNGDTHKLVVNIPPRLLKSRLCTVCFVAWLIGKLSGYRVLIASHDQKLADALVDDVHTLVRAPWYIGAFPGGGEGKDLSRSGHFRCQNGSEVMARSMEAGVTGHGFDLMIFDDPMDAGDANSPGVRERTIDLYERKFLSRLQSQRHSKVLIVAQRLHRDDLCGHLVDDGGWLSVTIPLVAKEAIVHQIGKAVWHRPAGDVLDPDRYPSDWIELQERRAPSVFAAQYQQTPFLTESTILQRSWIRTYAGRHPLEAHRITMSVDGASSRKQGSSFTCILVWASDGADHYLLEVVRDRMLYPDIFERVLEMIRRFRPQTVLIEDKSVGHALIPDLTKRLIASGSETSVKAVTPVSSKANRLRQHIDVFANGHVLVPEGRPSSEAFIDELMLFEESGFNDQVDATTQYLDYARERLGLTFAPIIVGAGGSMLPPRPGYLTPRPIDRSTLRKPAHGQPSLRDPRAPRPNGGFRR